MGTLGVPELLMVLIMAALVIWPAARICRKAGFSPWLGIAAIVPGANIFLLWYLAWAKWPNDGSRESAG